MPRLPSVEWARGSSFPKNNFKKVQDLSGGTRNAIKFFNYWASIPADKVERAIVTVYRLHPQVDLKKVDPKAKNEWAAWRGKIPFKPEDYREVFLKEWGSGDWRCDLYEDTIDGKVMQAFFPAQDRQNFPPKLDYRTIIHGVFENKEYIQWLERQPGLDLPWTKTPEQQEEKDEMTIAGMLADHNKELREEIKEQRAEFQEQIEEIQAEPDQEQQVVTSATDKILTTALDMLKTQTDKVAENSAKSYDPIAVAKSVLEMTKEMKGDSAGVVTAMQTMAASQTAFLERLLEQQAKETDYWRKLVLERPAASAVPAAEPKSMLDQVEELAKFKALSRELFGNREPRESREPETPRKNWMETLLENPKFPELANGALGMAAQLISLLRAPQPGAPPTPVPDALKAALNGQPQPAQVAQPAPDPVAQARAATLAFMQRIEKPFIAAFYDLEQMGLNGYTFARHMHCEFVPDGQVTPAGRQEYETIRDRWGKQFDQVIRNYPPIWNMVQGNQAKYTEFLNEFMMYDTFVNSEEEPSKVAAIKAN